MRQESPPLPASPIRQIRFAVTSALVMVIGACSGATPASEGSAPSPSVAATVPAAGASTQAATSGVAASPRSSQASVASLPIGLLPAGTYTSIVMTPHITFTVPVGLTLRRESRDLV